MSNLTCPSCNSTLCETAAYCFNCGAKITVCPNCRSVFSKEVLFCSACGAKISLCNNCEESLKEGESDNKVNSGNLTSQDSVSAHEQQYSITPHDVVEKTKRTHNAYQHIYGIPLRVILVLLILVLSVVAVYQVWVDEYSDGATFAAWALVISVPIIWILASEDMILPTWIKKWSMKENINLFQVINSGLSVAFEHYNINNFTEDADSLKEIILAEAYYSNPQIKSKRTLWLILSTVGSCVANIVAAIVICDIAEYLEFVIALSELAQVSIGKVILELVKLYVQERWYLIFLIVAVFVLSSVFDKIYKKIHESAAENFVKAYLPQHIATYCTYISNPEKAEKELRKRSSVK